MQIFTVQMLLDAAHQANEIKQMLFDAIFGAAWHNVLSYLGSTWTALLQHNWDALFIQLFMAVCLIVFLYRLVRKNLFMAVRSMLDR